MLVIKADGTPEQFKPNKLRTSLQRAGARRNEAMRIVQDIERTVTEGVTTETLYRQAFKLLAESTEPIAAKYSLRRALFGLGPTGFPFEDFLAKLFQAEGYKTKTRLILRGKCAIHEIDVAAYRPDHTFIAEAKFHMRPGVKSDLQVALYSYARFLDLQSSAVCKGDTCGIVSLAIVTNTKFTKAAIDYAKCSGLELISWGYPHGNSLQDRIERHNLYPITVLSKLSNREKAILMQNGTILCQDLLKNHDILSQFGIARKNMHAVIDEARQLLADPHT